MEAKEKKQITHKQLNLPKSRSQQKLPKPVENGM
jgi:hypothetical protein